MNARLGLVALLVIAGACTNSNPSDSTGGSSGGTDSSSQMQASGSGSSSSSSSLGSGSGSSSSSSPSSSSAQSSSQGSTGGTSSASSNASSTSSSSSGGAGSSSSSSGCVPAAEEVCDGEDNTCDGVTDEGFDLESNPRHCGSCDRDCFTVLSNVDPATVTCQTRQCRGTCAAGYYDRDADPDTCEVYCVATSSDDGACNNRDDDCDGDVDEDVDMCNSTHCGACNRGCGGLHATASECQAASGGTCGAGNARCVVTACECTGPGNCFFDADGNGDNGCEYRCDVTNGGVEICDGLDNDCDGRFDGVDDLGGDLRLGGPCSADPRGECGAPTHQGVTGCVAGALTCTGPDVLRPAERGEICNNLDDDCDGATDENPSDEGGPCGASDTFPCHLGREVCQAGRLACVGNTDPATETCNGIDDDCDGVTDRVTGTGELPSDSVGSCAVPIPPPVGVPSGCQAGNLDCIAGTVVCLDAVRPSATGDTCGVDSNCDGVLTGQPNTFTDVSNCGGCGNNCYAGSVHSLWDCVDQQCVPRGCAPGFYDLNGDGLCEYPCAFASPAEQCNNQDDDCDGVTDEDLVTPYPSQVCGVSPMATRPECTTDVDIMCSNGSWRCDFPAGVCNGNGCAATLEICDDLDNNCDGALNENAPTFGRACASDDGLPSPGHGPCRTVGSYICNGPNAAACSAVKADCNMLPGGCTEQCDGVDNDCDGVVDEAKAAPGTVAAFFVKPVVTKIGATRWITTYEASRMLASSAAQGVGNGYQTFAPGGVTMDRTRMCSAQGRFPWTNVTATEAEQACANMGGELCSVGDYTTMCQATASCTWGYSPRGAACTSDYTAAKFCNFSYDVNAATPGIESVMTITASPLLMNCGADWSGLQGNAGASTLVSDTTGNVGELTSCQIDRVVCGTDAAVCAARCCSGTSTVVGGAVRACGTLGANTRRLLGQSCNTAAQCCNDNATCSANGTCTSTYCGGCATHGEVCATSANCCGGEQCIAGRCGGAPAPYLRYSVMGGNFRTALTAGGACNFTSFIVDDTFRAPEVGFRCCFGANPN